jgi:hypothetical protein
MKELLIGFAVAFLLTTGAVYGAELTEVQKAELALQAAKAREAQNRPSIPVQVRQEAEAWSQLGTNVGTALIAAAKEIGVAANEFASTPLGQVVTFAVFFKMFGREFIDLLIGLPLLAIGVPALLRVALRGTIIEEKFETKPFLWIFTRKYRASVRYNNEEISARTVISLLAAAACFVASMIILF